jgi:two-component system, response regulator YesN
MFGKADLMNKQCPRPINVIVVDDDIDTREYISSAMFRWKKSGFEFNFCYAVDGQDCLEQMEKEPIDIVISDVKMPRMDGKELVKKIRSKNNPNRKVPIIVISAYDDLFKESGLEMEHPNIFVMGKPFELDEFYSKIRTSALMAAGN